MSLPIADRELRSTINYMTGKFERVTTQLYGRSAQSRAVRHRNGTTTPMYDAQVEFAHLLNEIMQAPRKLIPRAVSQAEQFIEGLAKHVD